MDKARVLEELENLLELEPGSLDGTEPLDELGWDSIALIGYIAMLDSEFGVVVPPSKLTSCATVHDLTQLVLAAKAA